MLRTVTKVLPEPAEGNSRGTSTRCLWRKLSTKEELDSSSPACRTAVPDNWAASDTEAKELLHILKRNSHLTARKVETMSLWPPPTKIQMSLYGEVLMIDTM
jgi:hypothetical protein